MNPPRDGVTAEAILSELLRIRRGEGTGTWFEMIDRNIRKTMHDFIDSQLQAAREEGYEAARVDLNAIHGAKWAKEDYNKGFSDALDEAARVAEEYLTKFSPMDFEDTKEMSTHMSNWIAERIRALKKP